MFNSFLKMKWFLASVLLGYTGLLVYLSHIPGKKISYANLFPHSDKLWHLLFFGALALVAHHALKAWTAVRLTELWAWIYVAIFGIGDEWMQTFVPRRYADVMDWVADISGAALFLWIANRLEQRLQQDNPAPPDPNDP
ncbi:MAG: VanZ family protein, partial [Magnetococcales bacterium]|nr:VanZ family protein [Magnetococcales bacterium]